MANVENSLSKTTYWRSTKADSLGVYRYIPFPNTCVLNRKPRHDARTNADYVLIDGDLLKVNTHKGKYEVRTDIVWSGYWCMKWMRNKYKRIYQIRLESPSFEREEECQKFSREFKKLIRFIKKYYNAKDVQYLYVREYSDKKSWHFHIVLWIDGKLCRSQYVIWQKWSQILWDAHLLTELNKHDSANGLHMVKKGGQMLKLSDPNGTLAAVRAWSYLAKPRTKGRGALNTRDFQTSMLPRTGS